jgi:hypothetical protein
LYGAVIPIPKTVSLEVSMLPVPLENIGVTCEVLSVDLEHRGLLLKVYADKFLPGLSDYPMVIVVPCEQRVTHTYRGEELLWVPLAKALADRSRDQLTVRVTGTMKLSDSVPLYLQQPEKDWPSQPTVIITPDHLTIN